jgi:excisionase family DNA binding protein
MQPNVAPDGEWVSLGRACKLLGVNESTLRRWADAGRVRSFRTPGGHRRFAEDDLHRLQQGAAPVRERLHQEYAALGSLAVARIRRRLQRGRGHEAPWYSTVDEAGRVRLRPLGRRLVDLAEESLRGRTRGGRLLEEARAIGREYGEELAGGGVPVRDAVEAFTFFRRSLDETTRQLAQREGLNADESAEAWDHVSGLADAVLVAMMDAFSYQPSAVSRQPSDSPRGLGGELKADR